MSLSRIALRIAAVEALKGRTLVGDRVLDSPNGAIDVQADGSLRTAESRPFISVYTDSGSAKDITGRSMIENGDAVIVFEFGISAAMLEKDEETGAMEMVGIEIPASDSAYEFALDIVQRQIVDALTDPGNAWAEIYRSMHFAISQMEYAGARTASDGQRLAGHQLRVTVSLVPDPLTGEALEPDMPMAIFLAAMEASEDETHHTKAATMRSILEGTNAPWEALQRRHGMTADELHALGHHPLETNLDGSAPEMNTGTIQTDGTGEVTESGS